jgi:hypothetical protein
MLPVNSMSNVDSDFYQVMNNENGLDKIMTKMPSRQTVDAKFHMKETHQCNATAKVRGINAHKLHFARGAKFPLYNCSVCGNW